MLKAVKEQVDARRHRINVGCGQLPTHGWRNFDNSFSLRLSKIRVLPGLLRKLGLLDRAQYGFILFARENDIEYADATRGLPFADRSVDVVYSSHMLEHLDNAGAGRFLCEAWRVLRDGGTIRLAVPDLQKQVALYNESGDADVLVRSTYLTVSRPRSVSEWLHFVLVGSRHHQWMYDGTSLTRLLQTHGFVNAEVMPAGRTRISDPGALYLYQRTGDSVYAEAEKADSSGSIPSRA